MKKAFTDNALRRVGIGVLTAVCFSMLSVFCLSSSAAVLTVPSDYSTIQGAIARKKPVSM